MCYPCPLTVRITLLGALSLVDVFCYSAIFLLTTDAVVATLTRWIYVDWLSCRPSILSNDMLSALTDVYPYVHVLWDIERSASRPITQIKPSNGLISISHQTIIHHNFLFQFRLWCNPNICQFWFETCIEGFHKHQSPLTPCDLESNDFRSRCCVFGLLYHMIRLLCSCDPNSRLIITTWHESIYSLNYLLFVPEFLL